MKFKNRVTNLISGSHLYTDRNRYNLSMYPDSYMNLDEYITHSNYNRLSDLTDNDEVLKCYWIDKSFLMYTKEYHYELYNMWYDSVYVNSTDSEGLIFTIPKLTLHVTNNYITCITNEGDGHLTDDEIQNGLIPILMVIISIHKTVKQKHIESQKLLSSKQAPGKK